MSTELPVNNQLDSLQSVNLDHFQHESSLNPLLKNCLSRTLLEGLDKGRAAIKETLDATADLEFLRELKGTLQKHYDMKTKILTVTPELMEQFKQLRENPEHASKAAILDVIGINTTKMTYTKDELDLIRENINQDIEATNKRIDHAHHRGTEIYNLNMQIVQMLKAITRGLQAASDAPTKKIHR